MISQELFKHGIYRGIVLDNNDDGIFDGEKFKPCGRCKVFFEGIYPEIYKQDNGKMLPWAEPIYPIFGGNANITKQKEQDGKSNPKITKNYTNNVVGWTSVPHIGAYVWGFFEDGNIQFPKFFGMTQSIPNFMSEHIDQHVIATDNVKIVIDENPTNKDSTNKFDSNNANSTKCGSQFVKKQMPTTINITITAKPTNGEDPKDICAVNLNVIGNINANITGNIYENVVGDKFITQKGNLYHKIIGDIEIEHKGTLVETHEGTRKFIVTDKNVENYKSTNDITVDKDQTVNLLANQTTTIGQHNKLNIGASETRESGGVMTDKGAMILHN